MKFQCRIHIPIFVISFILHLYYSKIFSIKIGKFNLNKKHVVELSTESIAALNTAPKVSKEDNVHFDFSILSWNVLAQSLARSEMHPHVKKGMLKEKLRIPLILLSLKRTLLPLIIDIVRGNDGYDSNSGRKSLLLPTLSRFKSGFCFEFLSLVSLLSCFCFV